MRMSKRWMLLRMITASLARRKSRVAIAMAAIIVGSAISSGLASVYYDIGEKMSQELRVYGANLVLAPVAPENQPYVSLKDVSEVASQMDGRKLVGYVPYLYGVARLESINVVIVGTDFSQIEKVFPSWKITGGKIAGLPSNSAIVGEAVASRLALAPGERIELASTTTLKTVPLQVAGILATGASQDNQIFIDISVAGNLLDKPGMTSVAYFSLLSSLPELESFSRKIGQEFDGLSADPVRQVSQSEGSFLKKIGSLLLLAVTLILLLTLLCVGITMMNATMERRREIGLRKALGAQDRDIILELLAEGAVLGITGGFIGWALGLLLAQVIGQSVFQSAVSLRLEILPLSLLLTVALVVLASFIPARAAASIQPATTLRGE